METPYFLIDRKKFIKNCDDIISSFQHQWGEKVICGYSVKTNNHPLMLQMALEKGLYAEVVSKAEYELAKSVGFSDTKIIYNGPVKGETQYSAYEQGVKINIDNLSELKDMISYIEQNKPKRRGLGLRVNFNLEAETPGETATGEDVGRFGICIENGDLDRAIQALQENAIELEGLHIHYTTQSRSLNVYRAIAQKAVEICSRHEIKLQYIDIGGGFWGGRIVEGKPTMQQYAEVIANILKQYFSTDTILILEPGSAMSATVIDYHTTVISTKNIRNATIVVVDGSSLHINPFMNERNQTAEFQRLGNNVIEKQIVCGATCLEKDRFITLQKMGELKKGDEIIFTNAGAYTISLVSDFIVKKPEVYITD